MLKSYRDIDPAVVRRLLNYEPQTGCLTWLARPDDVRWSNQFAGKPALAAIGKGYRYGAICGFPVRAHLVVWAMHNGHWPCGHIDHINGNRLDNRIENLRVVSQQENNRNMPRRRDNTSGTTGVTWDKARGKWSAMIRHEGKTKHLGRFSHIEDAVSARRVAMQSFGYHPNHGR